MAADRLGTLKVVREVARNDILLCLARVPGASRAFLGSSDFKVYEADLGREKPLFKELGKHNSYVTGLALAGKVLVSGSYDRRLIWWDLEKRSPIRVVDAHKKWLRAVRATRDGKV